VNTIGYVYQEDTNRTRNVIGRKHHKTKVVNQKVPMNEVILLEKKPDNLTLNKPSEPGDNMHLAVFPVDLDCVDVVQQQHSRRNHHPRESSGSISHSSNCENGSVSS
jgi:hypothetical protein